MKKWLQRILKQKQHSSDKRTHKNVEKVSNDPTTSIAENEALARETPDTQSPDVHGNATSELHNTPSNELNRHLSSLSLGSHIDTDSMVTRESLSLGEVLDFIHRFDGNTTNSVQHSSSSSDGKLVTHDSEEDVYATVSSKVSHETDRPGYELPISPRSSDDSETGQNADNTYEEIDVSRVIHKNSQGDDVEYMSFSIGTRNEIPSPESNTHEKITDHRIEQCANPYVKRRVVGNSTFYTPSMPKISIKMDTEPKQQEFFRIQKQEYEDSLSSLSSHLSLSSSESSLLESVLNAGKLEDSKYVEPGSLIFKKVINMNKHSNRDYAVSSTSKKHAITPGAVDEYALTQNHKNSLPVASSKYVGATSFNLAEAIKSAGGTSALKLRTSTASAKSSSTTSLDQSGSDNTPEVSARYGATVAKLAATLKNNTEFVYKHSPSIPNVSISSAKEHSIINLPKNNISSATPKHAVKSPTIVKAVHKPGTFSGIMTNSVERIEDSELTKQPINRKLNYDTAIPTAKSSLDNKPELRKSTYRDQPLLAQIIASNNLSTNPITNVKPCIKPRPTSTVSRISTNGGAVIRSSNNPTAARPPSSHNILQPVIFDDITMSNLGTLRPTISKLSSSSRNVEQKSEKASVTNSGNTGKVYDRSFSTPQIENISCATVQQRKSSLGATGQKKHSSFVSQLCEPGFLVARGRGKVSSLIKIFEEKDQATKGASLFSSRASHSLDSTNGANQKSRV